MSASAEIFRFPDRGSTNGGNGAWSNQDIADVYRCLDIFARNGLSVEAASGMSEEGDPWFSIEDTTTGDALVHIARIDGFFIVHVLDGEAWSGDTLRDALSQLDIGGLTGLEAGIGHHDAAADGDDDRDGTHAFLRIVSAVVAVLTADVIANAVTHEAAASPLPPTGAPDAGDHSNDGNKAVLDLPAVEATLPTAHRQETTAASTDDAGDRQPLAIKAEKTASHDLHDDSAAAVTVTVQNVQAPVKDVQVVTVQAEDVLDTGKMMALVAVSDRQESSGVALSFVAAGGDHVQVAFNEKAYFAGTAEKADTFIIILGKDETEVTSKVGDFEKGHDSLVIEQSDDKGTSSALITDLGALVANGGQQLTVIGQATMEIHLSAPGHSLVGGG